MSSELSYTPTESVHNTEKSLNVDRSVPVVNSANNISPTFTSKEYSTYPLNALPFSPLSVSKWVPEYAPGKYLTPTKAQVNINNEELTDANKNSSVASPSPYECSRVSSLATSRNESGYLKNESPQTTPVIHPSSTHDFDKNKRPYQNITYYEYKGVSPHSSKATQPPPQGTNENVLPVKFVARGPDRNDNIKSSSVKTGFTFRRHQKLQNVFSIRSGDSSRNGNRYGPVTVGHDPNVSVPRPNANQNEILDRSDSSDLSANSTSKNSLSNIEIDRDYRHTLENALPQAYVQSQERYHAPNRIQPQIVTLKVAEERGDKKDKPGKDRNKHRKSDDSEDANDKRKKKDQSDGNEKSNDKDKKKKRSEDSEDSHDKKRKSQPEPNDRTKREHVEFDKVYFRNIDDPPSGLIHPVGSIRYDTPFPGIPIINRKDYEGKHFEVNQEYIRGNDVLMPNTAFGKSAQYLQGPVQESRHLRSIDKQQYSDYPEHTSRLDVSINNRYHGSSSIGGGGGRDITNYDNYGGNNRMNNDPRYGSQGSVFRDHDSNVNVYVNRSSGGDNGNGPNNNGNGNGPNGNGNGYGPGNNGNGNEPGNRGNPRGYGNGYPYDGDPNNDGMQYPNGGEGDEWYPNDDNNGYYGDGNGNNGNCCCPGPTPMPIPIPYPIPIFPPNPTPPCPCSCPCPPPKRKKKRKKKCKSNSQSQSTEWNMLTMYGMYSLFHQMQTNWQAQIQESMQRSQPQQQYGVMLGNPMQMMMSSMMSGQFGACGMSPQTQAQQPNPIFEVVGLDVHPTTTEEC